ncbi:hypothetical protein BCON_0018g00220 [Botryotinia convoluta]|uniref:Uncharacterized protein n=1 Tax=Botryotinia convoluta TaxID=54673 RepID=A0A4Z1ILV4_9HELO|nr:hypothetical protein BCON_0018g00220 [Botryotinia convoluta]
MADPCIKEGTAKRVDVKYKCKVNLPADTPSGHSHIIKWNAGVDKNKVPRHLFTVDVIATILYEFNPSALSHLLDVQAGHFYCWWETNGHIEESENDKEYQSETVNSESKKSGDLLLDYIHIHRVGQFVRVGIVGCNHTSRCSDLEVNYAICDEGNWDIVSSQDRSHDKEYYLYTSSPDLCKAHDYKLARVIIRETAFEDKKNMKMGYHRDYGLENGAGAPKYSRRKTQNISNVGRITEVSQQGVQESEIGSGGSSRFVDEMFEVQEGTVNRIAKHIHTVATEYYSSAAKANIDNPGVLRPSFDMQVESLSQTTFEEKLAYSILHFINPAQAKPRITMEDEFCKKIDLNLNISVDLPADAPQGHPHLLNVGRPQNNPHLPKCKKRKSKQIEFPEDLSLIDVLATILFDWKPTALHHLLNVENEQFYCAAEWEEGSVKYNEWDRFVYVHRLGQYVRIVISGIESGAKISYRICNNGKWKVMSAQEYDPTENRICLVPSDRVERCACKEIEKKMARRMAQQYLADIVLEDRIFPVIIYEPEAKSTKGQKSKGTTTSELNDVGRESNTGSSSDTPMEGNTNLRFAELEAQVLVLQKSIEELTGPARKRRRED